MPDLADKYEIWGTFSVMDHLRPGAFLAEVVLYDRLVIPSARSGVGRDVAGPHLLRSSGSGGWISGGSRSDNASFWRSCSRSRSRSSGIGSITNNGPGSSRSTRQSARPKPLTWSGG